MSQLTQPNLSEVKRVYLERDGAWRKRAFEEAPKEMETLSLTDLRNHLETVLSLISDAIEKGGTTSTYFGGFRVSQEFTTVSCRRTGCIVL